MNGTGFKNVKLFSIFQEMFSKSKYAQKSHKGLGFKNLLLDARQDVLH
jgi:hypothetical protein